MYIVTFLNPNDPGKLFFEEPIDNAESMDLIRRRESLLGIFEQEDIYSQLIDSHVKFKSYLYSESIKHSTYDLRNSFAYYDTRSSINSLIFNSLNLGKLLLDRHYHKEKNRCYAFDVTGDNSTIRKVEEFRREIFDGNTYYRVGCKLRSFVQHSSIAVRNLVTGLSRDKDFTDITSIFNIPLNTEILYLKGDLKSKVGSTIDLHRVMDCYVDAISEMHIHSRALVTPFKEDSLSIFQAKIQDIYDRFGTELKDISIYEKVDKSKGEHELRRIMSLSCEWFEIAKALIEKYKRKTNFTNFKHDPYHNVRRNN